MFEVQYKAEIQTIDDFIHQRTVSIVIDDKLCNNWLLSIDLIHPFGKHFGGNLANTFYFRNLYFVINHSSDHRILIYDAAFIAHTIDYHLCDSV